MEPGQSRKFTFEDGGFLLLVLAVSLGFALVVKPFFGAILWALVLAILFGPVHARLLRRMPKYPNGASLLTLLLIVLIVILPAIFVAASLIQEFVQIYKGFQSGKIDIAVLFTRAVAAMPHEVAHWLESRGWADFSAARQQVTEGLQGSVHALAGQALSIGQKTLDFIFMLALMLYLTFFLLRDGDALARRVIESIPLRDAQRDAVLSNFTTVIRATIKGSLVVAIVQGTIGGLVFWFLGVQGALLWGLMMGLFSLIPAIGTGLVWVPVALYLLATGAIVKGLILVFCGLFVIGLVDNILRPILVGRDTRMPDYVVLISTLGGLQVFGFHGFVIGPIVAALFICVWNIFTETRLGANGGQALAQGASEAPGERGEKPGAAAD